MMEAMDISGMKKDSAAQTYAKKNSIPFTILPTGVTIKQGKSSNMLAGEKLALTAVIAPKGATTKLKWSSSNEKVATVSSKGVVKAIGKGKATITVTTDNGKKATFKVNVPTAPAEVKLSKTSATVVVGESLKLKAAVSPSGAKTKLTWSSSNEKVAKVTQKGVVSALKKGSATITAKVASYEKECALTVNPPRGSVDLAPLLCKHSHPLHQSLDRGDGGGPCVRRHVPDE